MDDPGHGQRISFHQPRELLPSDLALPRSPRQPLPPEPPRLVDNGGQALIVAADAEVSEVPLEHLAESTMLLGQRPRPHAAALRVDRLERPRQMIFGGTLPHRFCTGALGRRSEVNQPGLVRMELQPELGRLRQSGG